MTRKKIIDEENSVEAAANLADDEEITISDVRTIRRGRPPKQPEIIDVEPEPANDDFEDAELVDENPYPVGSVGYRAFQDEDSPQITECNILVTRKPDGAGDNFLTPCKSRLSLSPIRNIELTMSESEIEEIVRNTNGGGHYYLQTQFGNTLGKGWSVSLADPPENIAKAKAAEAAAATPVTYPVATAEPPRDPMSDFLDTLEKQKRMRDLLFGEELRELQQLRQKAAEPPPLAEPRSETLTILEKALQSENPTITDRLLDYAFPTKEESSSHWLTDIIKLGLEHKDELAGIAQTVLGDLMPRPQPSSLEAMLKAAPPQMPQASIPQMPPPVFEAAKEPPPTLSNFKRRDPTNEPEIEPEAIDGEPVETEQNHFNESEVSDNDSESAS